MHMRGDGRVGRLLAEDCTKVSAHTTKLSRRTKAVVIDVFVAARQAEEGTNVHAVIEVQNIGRVEIEVAL